jgi:CheY-like chemotaxis protein
MAVGTQGRTVVVVDDDEAVRRYVKEVLSRSGYVPVPATTAETTWDLLQIWEPDALIVDIGLPGMNGWELVAQCRGDERFRCLPILVISGLPVSGDELMAARCDAFLEKPFGPEALTRWVESVLSLPLEQDGDALATPSHPL